jgi:hypothetical protein
MSSEREEIPEDLRAAWAERYERMLNEIIRQTFYRGHPTTTTDGRIFTDPYPSDEYLDALWEAHATGYSDKEHVMDYE